jgi:hypothetical protein
LQVCFCGTKGAIDEYRFTCVVLCGGTIDNVFTAEIEIPKSSLWGIWGYGDFAVSQL